MRWRRQGLRLALLVAVGVACSGLGIVTYALDALRVPELATLDARFDVRGRQPPPRDLVVVSIDDVTFSDLGLRWPFPRSVHARLIDRLRGAGARVIAYDVQFTEASDPAQDNALFDSVQRAGNVVLATAEVGPKGSTNVLGGDQNLRDARATAGWSNFPLDPGGVIRRFRYSFHGLPSIAVATVRRSTGHRVKGSGTPWIDFRGPRATIKTVSFSRALRGLTPAGTFRNKVVVVGAGNPTLHDEHPTATSPAMNGPEIQANTIWTVDHGAPLTGAAGWIDIALIVLLGSFAPVVSLRLSALPALAASGIVLAVFLLSAQLAFNGGTVLAVTYPASVLTIGAIGALAVHYFTEVRERRRTRAAFARFVPAAVVDQVLEQVEDGLRLGGTEVEGTVMFSDIRGFTTFSEATPAPRVIEILNHYLTEMTEAILANGGTLVAFLGDGIMAVFGAPIAQPDHADRALRAAREMLDERLPRFNTWLREQGVADGFRMGIGLNSGPFMAGNVGSEQRLEYTVIGDTTNTAARLEGMTKGTPHQLFIADSTHSLLADETSNLVYVDEFAVRGRQAKIKIWSVADAAAPER